jgi:AmmeMemoRadiSam system protein B
VAPCCRSLGAGLGALFVLVVLATGCDKRAAPRPQRVRPPAQAGIFYPADPGELAAKARALVDAAPRVAVAKVRMLLAPHGGLHYSGRVAGRAFRQLDSDFSRVVIVAANHVPEVDFEGVAVDDATSYRMPGFDVPVDDVVSKLLHEPGFVLEPRAHEKHVVEVELPFLRVVRGDGFRIVPLIVGHVDAAGRRRLVDGLAELATPETVFVFSVDLSHDQPYERAASLDRACVSAIERRDAEGIARCDSDGTQVLSTMNELATRLGLAPHRIAAESSGDVNGDESSVVGYAAMAYERR